MSYEAVPGYERQPELPRDEYDPLHYQEHVLQRFEEPQTTTECLGGVALRLIVGGALMTGGGVMPGTEAVTLELLAGTTELADTEHEQRIAA